jgi:antiviral helicase SKI2
LQAGTETIKRIATRVAETQIACGMDTPVDTYLAGLHFGLVEVVYEWARGMPFAEITGRMRAARGRGTLCCVAVCLLRRPLGVGSKRSLTPYFVFLVTGLTDVLEGSIVRCIVRLDETCRDIRNAAKVIGDPVLYQKMDEVGFPAPCLPPWVCLDTARRHGTHCARLPVSCVRT